MINFLYLSALLSLTSALCLQRNAKKMNGANISPSFYSFFIFFSIFVFVLLLLPSFLSILPFFLFFLSFLSFSSSCYFFCLFFLSLSLFRFVFPCVPILIPPFLFLLFLFLLFLFLFFLFLLLSFFRRVRSTAKVPYRQRQASSQILCPLSQSTISVRNLTRHASLCLLHCRLLCKL